MLFSERYKDFIELENGEPVDHICGKIDYPVKKQVSVLVPDNLLSNFHSPAG